MKNYHIIKLTNLPATNYKPARIKITSQIDEESVIISYTNEPGDFSPTVNTALRYLEAKGFEFIGQGAAKQGNHLISTTFKSIKN